MITAQNKLIEDFLADVVDGEECNSISLITSQDSSNLVKFLSKKKLDQLYIQPFVDNNLSIQSDLYAVLDDAKFNISDIGIVKNLLSQKIIVFISNKNKSIDKSNLLKLGF